MQVVKMNAIMLNARKPIVIIQIVITLIVVMLSAVIP